MTYHHHRARFDENHLTVLDIETISGEEMPDGGFPPWCTHTPIVASILTADRSKHGEWTFAIETVRFSEDHGALERIDELLAGRSCLSFSGRGFDFPVLSLAAKKARNFSLRNLRATATEPRYHSARHYDVADKISGYGAARGATLEKLCKELGIAAKVDVHGSEVGELYEQGRVDEIAAYCEGDVASTLLLFAYQRAFEEGDEGYFASLTFQFTRWIHMAHAAHLMPFAEVRDLDDLLRLSLLGQLKAARANAKVDADERELRRIDDSFTSSIRY